MGDLESIIRAMKALAAVRIRQARETVASLHRYRETVDLGLQVALRHRPRSFDLRAGEEEGRLAVVVFGSDLGLAGRFNVRIAEFADRHAREMEPDPGRRVVVAVGRRVVSELTALGHEVAVDRPAPANVDGIVATVQDLLVDVDGLRARSGVERVVLFHNFYHSGAEYRPHLLHLLPLNPEWLKGLAERPWEGPSLPRARIPWEQLFSALVQERLFVSIFGAAAESHASEHASRLAAMEAAEQRVGERIQELTGRFHRERQERINAELLDLVTGYAALEEETDDPSESGRRPRDG